MTKRFRRLVLRVRKAAIMVAIAMGLSVSLVVTTPSNAQAFVPPVPAPVVFGATRMAIPALMPVAAALGPVGWGLAGVAAVAALGVGLYETRDYWLPYVTGDYGKSSEPSGYGRATWVATGNYKDAQTHIPNSPQMLGYYVNIPMRYDGPKPVNFESVKRTMSMSFQCKRSSGTVYTKHAVAHKTWDVNSASPMTYTAQAICDASTDTNLGGIAGPFQGDPKLGYVNTTGVALGPTEIWQWGNYINAQEVQPGFDPKSPDVKYTTTVECIDSAGTRVNLSKEWTGDSAGMLVPACEAAGLGHGTGQIKVEGLQPGKTTKETLWEAKAPAATGTQYDLCSPNRSQSGCKLAVKIDGKDCVMGLWDCENWTEVNANDPGKDGTTPRVQCQYGPYSVPLNTCNPLERAYEPEGAPVSEPNIDGSPSTRSNTNLDGSPQPKPDPAKTDVAGVPGGAAATTPESASPDAKRCYPQGWGMLNPVEWVLKPVGCALEAAFVPKTQTVQAQSTRIQEKVKTVGFGSVTTAWMDTFDAVGGGSGCSGPTVNFSFASNHQSLQPFNACSQPMATVAGITYAFSSIVIVLAGGLGIARAISTGFGFNFTLGRGSSE